MPRQTRAHHPDRKGKGWVGHPARAGERAQPPLRVCGDGIDNDRDGLTDMADTGWSSPNDDSESRACGLGFEFVVVLPVVLRMRRRV